MECIRLPRARQAKGKARVAHHEELLAAPTGALGDLLGDQDQILGRDRRISKARDREVHETVAPIRETNAARRTMLNVDAPGQPIKCRGVVSIGIIEDPSPAEPAQLVA